MYALRNCPRLKEVEIEMHKLSMGLMEDIAKYGQKLRILNLDFRFTKTSGILNPLKSMKNLRNLGLYQLTQGGIHILRGQFVENFDPFLPS